MSLEEKQEMSNNLRKNEEFLKKQYEILEKERRIEEKRKEIAEFIGSEEYKVRKKRSEKKEYLSNISGKKVSNYREIVFELSFYSDLNVENGFGSINALGERLSDGMVANNKLPFGTMIYLENGYGLKVVKDRGSEKYFSTVNKMDVFIPRNYGEDDSQYYKRVNNMGRKRITGYILEVE